MVITDHQEDIKHTALKSMHEPSSCPPSFFYYLPIHLGASWLVKNSPANTGHVGSILGWEDPWEEGMATHSSILAWRIPRTEKPGGYSPWGHREADMTAHTHARTDLFTRHNLPSASRPLCRIVQTD